MLSHIVISHIELPIPLSEFPQSCSQGCTRLEPEVTFQSTRIRIGHRYITRLHRYQFLVSVKIIILRQHASPYQFLAQNLHEVQQVFRVVVTNVIESVRRNRKPVLARSSVRSLSPSPFPRRSRCRPMYVKSRLAVAVVEYPDCLTGSQLTGEAKVSHIRPASRTIHCEEPQTP